MTATLQALAADLAAGRTTARRLTEACFARIEDAAGQGKVAFISTDKASALAQADAADRLRASGAAPSAFAGIPVAIKDLFDVAGERTRAGSRVVGDAPATQDAPTIARLRRAGMVFVGRANMTEFAFSGLGMNAHYGDPLSPWRREERHISGGSTSGGAVAVADGMAAAALGTDTGGSCRIPAAFCGLVGFKPTASRIPREGAVPLSTTLDSIGSIGHSVRCCAIMDGLLSADAAEVAAPPLKGLKFAALQTTVLDGLNPAVAAAYEFALRRLADAGATVTPLATPEFADIAAINRTGGFSAAESYAWQKDIIAARPELYDQRVLARIRRGAAQTPADLAEMAAGRRALIAAFRASMTGFDAFLMPTAPILPPRLDELQDEAAYARINLLVLRNASIVNMVDGCAASVPIGDPASVPVGLGIGGVGGSDRRLLAIAEAVEAVVSARRGQDGERAAW